MIADARRGADVRLGIVNMLTTILKDRRSQNKDRADHLVIAGRWWMAAVALAFAELVYAVIMRIYG